MIQPVHRRLTSAAATARAEPLAVAAGVVVLPLMHVARREIDGRKVARRMAGASSPVRRADAVEAGRSVAVAVYLGARLWRLDDRSCVARSLLVWSLVSRRGIDAEVQVGFREVGSHRGDPDAAPAHAWVEVEGRPIDDSPDVSARYRPFAQPYLASAHS